MMNSDQIKEAPTDNDRLEEVAARELAYAFATIEEYRDYLPADFYKTFADLTTDLYSQANWDTNPDLARIVGPHILRAAIKNIAAKEAY
jgi:hypothetical protein